MKGFLLVKVDLSTVRINYFSIIDSFCSGDTGAHM